MKSSLAATFLELGDSTSRNLQFSHRVDVSVSYGEETITEMNLLEVRRRHPKRVYIRTFSKAIEAKTGADWEWHIIGRKRTVKMRVQAKGLQCNDVLKVKHKVASSGKQQRKLLIDGAQADNMKPVYCIYCTERQRRIWKELAAPRGYRSFQTGCLLADAADVPLTTRKLCEIEDRCIPWHYLVERCRFVQKRHESITAQDEDRMGTLFLDVEIMQLGTDVGETDKARPSGWNAPIVDDLNRDTGRDFDRTGVEETTAEDEERLATATVEGHRMARYDQERLLELGICRMVVIDVRDEADSEELRRSRD